MSCTVNNIVKLGHLGFLSIWGFRVIPWFIAIADLNSVITSYLNMKMTLLCCFKMDSLRKSLKENFAMISQVKYLVYFLHPVSVTVHAILLLQVIADQTFHIQNYRKFNSNKQLEIELYFNMFDHDFIFADSA